MARVVSEAGRGARSLAPGRNFQLQLARSLQLAAQYLRSMPGRLGCFCAGEWTETDRQTLYS